MIVFVVLDGATSGALLGVGLFLAFIAAAAVVPLRDDDERGDR